jgi:hypothetical protein
MQMGNEIDNLTILHNIICTLSDPGFEQIDSEYYSATDKQASCSFPLAIKVIFSPYAIGRMPSGTLYSL